MWTVSQVSDVAHRPLVTFISEYVDSMPEYIFCYFSVVVKYSFFHTLIKHILGKDFTLSVNFVLCIAYFGELVNIL